MAAKPIKITVATVARNAAGLIERTILSVEQQIYPAVEHLIIDGNSNDDTLQIVQHYIERNSIAAVRHEINCLSEPDAGIYDAMNKALSLSTGRYIVFLNAGDTLPHPDTLSRIAALIGQQEADPAVVYGDTDVTDGEGNFLRHRRLAPPEDLDWHDFKQGMLVCHQAFYARTDIARRTPYNLKYRLSADYDWALRVMKEAEQRDLSLVYAKAVVANYMHEGATTRNHRRSLIERFRIMTHHFGLSVTLAQHFWFVLRLFIKK
ncbi:MAG: glycosyltransferase [Alloprevotella sp.]|nr:glycosyltransferase [Alloprevotella sp.]